MTKLVKPTESELDILSILWEKESATVKEVHELILSYKKIGYTTTLKLMQIMNEKGLVSRDTQSKKHCYQPRPTNDLMIRNYPRICASFPYRR
jgi:predicted transcriptional regulator